MNETTMMDHACTGAQATLLTNEAFESTPTSDSKTDFREFYDRNHDFVWRNLQRLGVAPDMVEDAVQEVMVRLHDCAEDAPDPTAERKRVFAMVRRIAALFRRTQQRRTRRHDAWDQVSRYAPARTAASESQKLEASVAISRLLGELSSLDREVITLVDLEGLSGPELATVQGTSLNTAYARIRVARRHVRELVHDDQPQRHRALHPACAALLMLPGADPETRVNLREAFTATADDRSRGWQNFVEDLGPGALTSTAITTTAGASTSALAYKLYAGTVGLAAGIAVGVGGTTLYHRANPETVSIQPAPPVATAPLSGPAVPANPVPDEPPEIHPEPPSAPVAAQARADRARPRTRKPVDEDARRLKLEVQAIEAALKAMDAGDFEGALRTLDKAQYQVGAGLMKAERRALRAKIHCYKSRGAHNTACER